MKKIFFLLITASIFLTSCSVGGDDLFPRQQGFEDNPNGGGGDNTSSVPGAVRSVFNARYPNATRIEWKQLSNGNFKAEFFRGNVKWQTIFTPDGTVVKEEHD